jgi:hypothetical protein
MGIQTYPTGTLGASPQIMSNIELARRNIF